MYALLYYSQNWKTKYRYTRIALTVVAIRALKYSIELFPLKPQAKNFGQTRSGLILEEFSKQLPFDQIGSFSLGLILQTTTAAAWSYLA